MLVLSLVVQPVAAGVLMKHFEVLVCTGTALALLHVCHLFAVVAGHYKLGAQLLGRLL
jgi:hypothetical protein